MIIKPNYLSVPCLVISFYKLNPKQRKFKILSNIRFLKVMCRNKILWCRYNILDKSCWSHGYEYQALIDRLIEIKKEDLDIL